MRMDKWMKDNGWIYAGGVVLMLLALAWTLRDITLASRNLQLADEMSNTVSARIVLRARYLLYPSQQLKTEWDKKTSTLEGLLATALKSFTSAQDKALLQKVQKNFEATLSGMSPLWIQDTPVQYGAATPGTLEQPGPRQADEVFKNAFTLRNTIRSLFVSTMQKNIQARNNVFGVVGFFVFIGFLIAQRMVLTERNRTSKALSLGEGKFKAIFDHASDGIMLVDPQTMKIFDANQSMGQLLAYGHEELTRMGVRDIHPPQAFGSAAERFDKGPKNQVLMETDVPFKRKDGSLIYADISSHQIELEGKQYMMGIFRDATSRRTMEESLRKSEERYRYLFEYSSDALMTLKPPDWNFTSGNPETVRMFGAKDSKDFNSYRPGKLSPEKQPDGRPSGEKAKEMIEKAMREGNNLFEWTHKRINGEDFPATVLLTRMELEGKQFLQATVRDITLSKKIEEANLGRETAESANRAKSAFLATMSHELRTPLNAIIGFSDMMKSGDVGPLTAKQSEYALNIYDSGKHLLSLINDILDLNKIETGKVTSEASEVDLRKLLESSLMMVTDKIQKKRIKVSLQVAREAGVVYADERMIKQVVNNLLSNAVKFTPEGGEIRLTAGGNNGEISICVEDTGIGIEEKDKLRIFNEFEQVQGGLNRQYGGTGLGLALSKKIADMQKGRLWCESKGKDKGSRFYLALPDLSAVRPQPAPGEVCGTETAERILILQGGVHVHAKQNSIDGRG